VRRGVFVAMVLFALAVLAAATEAQTYSLLYKFTNGKDGNSPGGLLDASGTLYGATAAGGSADYGTVFKVTSGGAKSANGEFPAAGLARDQAGNLYGTTSSGGEGGCGEGLGCGVVFKLTP
jgi:uncharacterized repeat protein (TIGR03803 family)